MANGRVVQPSSEEIVFSVRGADVALPVVVIEDDVDAAPLREGRLPTRRKHAKILPGEGELVPLWHGRVEGALSSRRARTENSLRCACASRTPNSLAESKIEATLRGA